VTASLYRSHFATLDDTSWVIQGLPGVIFAAHVLTAFDYRLSSRQWAIGLEIKGSPTWMLNIEGLTLEGDCLMKSTIQIST
jgi:hypothetical protein